MSHAMQDHPKWKGHLQRSSKMWSTELGNRKPLQYSCCQNPINSMKRQKYMTVEDESLRSDSVQYSTWEVQRAITLTPQRMKQLGKSLTTLKMLTLIKKKMFLGRKAMRNVDSILKSRDVTLPTKVCIVKARIFLGEISITSSMHMKPSLWQKAKRY